MKHFDHIENLVKALQAAGFQTDLYEEEPCWAPWVKNPPKKVITLEIDLTDSEGNAVEFLFSPTTGRRLFIE